MLGSKRRLVIFFDHGRLLPKPGFLAQMSQTAATGVTPGWKRWFEGPARSGQPEEDIRRTTVRTNHGTRHYPGSRPSIGRVPRRVRKTMEAPTGGGVDLGVVRRFVDVAVDALAAAREEIDALNVYPVPDGDTGTNMYLTMSAARDAIHQAAARDADVATALAAFRRGALLGARGNSGVLLSQMLGAIAVRLSRAEPGERNAA